MPNNKNWGQRQGLILTLVLIIASGALLRLIFLDIVPPGLDRDAAYNGSVALDWVYHGILPFWISNNSAPDPAMIDLQALSLAVLGASIFALRLPGAMAGILTLAIIYRLTTDLLADRPYARLGGLVATGAMAFSAVMVHFHRLGLRAILLPLVLGLFLIAFWRAWQRSSLLYFVLAGALLGVMMYVYPAARFAPFIVVALVIHQTIFRREDVLLRIKGLAFLGVAFLIVFGPQLAFFIKYPGTFARRATETSLLTNPLYEQLGVWHFVGVKLLSYVKMLGIEWSVDWINWYNPMGQTLLHPVFFAFFLLGFLVALYRLPRFSSALLFSTTGIMLSVDLVASNRIAPHVLRLSGAYPTVFALVGLGFCHVLMLLDRVPDLGLGSFGHALSLRGSTIGQGVTGGVVALLLMLSGILTYRDYFLRWVPSAQLEEGFNSNYTDIAEAKVINNTSMPIFIPLAEYERSVVRFLTSARAPRRVVGLDADWRPTWPSLDDEPVMVIVPNEPDRVRLEGPTIRHDPRCWALVMDGIVYLLPPLALPDLSDWNAALSQANAQTVENALGNPVAMSYTLARGNALPFTPSLPQQTLDVNFANCIRLIGATQWHTMTRPLETSTVDLFWQGTAPMKQDYAIFAHIIDDGQRAWAGEDIFPLMGVYHTRLWRLNEVVPTSHNIALPYDAPPGRYWYEFGWYSLYDGSRLPVLNEAGEPIDTRVVLGPLKVPMPPVADEEVTAATPVGARFGGEIELLAWKLEGDGLNLRPGQTLALTLYWQARARPSLDYTIFVHLGPANAPPLAQNDHQPVGGRYPTSLWDIGEVVRDNFELSLPVDIPPGQYELTVGLYTLVSGERLFTPGTQWYPATNNAVPLTAVNVRQSG